MFITLLVLWCAVLVAHTLPQFIRFNLDLSDVLPEPEEPETSVIHLFSGPSNGQVHELRGSKEELPHFLVQPYLPRDENGYPIPDEDRMIPGPNGMVYVKPSFAYYQQVTDSDYIYVRDISEQEMRRIQMTGELPRFKVDES